MEEIIDNTILNLEQKEAIRITRNAKGLYHWEIKVKSDNLGNEDLSKIMDIDDKLKKCYPHEKF